MNSYWQRYAEHPTVTAQHPYDTRPAYWQGFEAYMENEPLVAPAGLGGVDTQAWDRGANAARRICRLEDAVHRIALEA